MMVVRPCPGIGQETISPLRATPIPPNIMVSETGHNRAAVSGFVAFSNDLQHLYLR